MYNFCRHNLYNYVHIVFDMRVEKLLELNMYLCYGIMRQLLKKIKAIISITEMIT